MAVIALTSAHGSPGVSTTALTLTTMWRDRPVYLIEADVTGSSGILAGFFRTSLEHSRGLIDLAVAHQQGQLAFRLQPTSLPLPIDRPDSTRRFVPGLTSSTQASSMVPAWTALAEHFSALNQAGTDVLVDAGRLGTQHGPEPILRTADTVLVFTRTTMVSLAALNARLPALRKDLSDAGRGEGTLGIIAIGPGQPFTAQEIERELGVPVLGSIAWDPDNAAVYSDGVQPPRRHESSSLLTDARALAMKVQHHAQSQRRFIEGETEVDYE